MCSYFIFWNFPCCHALFSYYCVWQSPTKIPLWNSCRIPCMSDTWKMPDANDQKTIVALNSTCKCILMGLSTTGKQAESSLKNRHFPIYFTYKDNNLNSPNRLAYTIYNPHTKFTITTSPLIQHKLVINFNMTYVNKYPEHNLATIPRMHT